MVTDALRALASTLDRLGVPWYVFGAQAVAVRGAARATQDIDVTIDTSAVAIERVIAELERAGFRHRFPGMTADLLVRAAVAPLVHEGGMDVDLVVAGSGLEVLAFQRASVERLAGVPVPVIGATDLVVHKLLAGRGKDLDDCAAVLAAGGVDVDEVERLLAALEEALSRSDLAAAFRALRLAEGL